MILSDSFTLQNGVSIPKIGFGTWLLNNDIVSVAVKNAIEVGYRHIDTAEAYENEVGVGRGVRESGIARENIFVTTKLQAEFKDYNSAANAIEESLKRLDLDYIDLMLIHAPKPWEKYGQDDHYLEGNLEAWRALEDAYTTGKLKAIGVANFEQVDLQNLIDHATIVPMVDQVLSHIGNTPLKLVAYAQAHDILVEAHSPFGHGDLIQNTNLAQMANKYDVSVPQLAIRYLIQLNMLPLPKASTLEHMRSNADVDFEISQEDMVILKNFDSIQYSESTSVFPVYQD